MEIGSFQVVMAVVPPYKDFPCPIRQLLDVDDPVRMVAELVNGLKEGENPAAKLGCDRSLFEAFKSIQDLMMSGFRSASLVNNTVFVSLRPDALSIGSHQRGQRSESWCRMRVEKTTDPEPAEALSRFPC